MTEPVTPELIRAALAHIPANLPRDEWARVAMAVKSQFSDQTGFDLFDQWSASDPDRYNAQGTKSTWRSVKASGGVGIATLLHLAKKHGFTLPKTGQPMPTPSREELARRDGERAERNRAEQARIEADQARAAEAAAALWKSGKDDGASAYLVRKSVHPHGIRFAPDGCLLVPLRDGVGTLWNVQRIAPAPMASGAPEKLFLKCGRKSGLWHQLGTLASAAADQAARPVLLVAEGFATAASLHEATGYPAAVAFDAGNLLHVARALRQLHPAALLVVCGDDDTDTAAKTGNNPGRSKATAAAKAVGGVVVFPEGLPPGGSDFNDAATHHGGDLATGLAAVRATVQRAIDAAPAPAAPPTPATTPPASATAPPNAKPGKGKGKASASASGGAGGVSGGAADRFYVNEAGLWYEPPGDDGGLPKRVCGPLMVTSLARDSADNNAAYLLEFDTPYKTGRRWLMPLTMLAGDGASMRAALLSQGFMTPTDSRRRAWLTEYIQSRIPSDIVRHVPRVGWHGRCYVLPDETLGTNPSGERVIFHSEAGAEARFSSRGKLDLWQRDLSRLCVGNSRFAFAVSTAFAGPLLAWAPGIGGGGFQYTGPTSIGKTTGFLIAASVWGKGTENDPDSYVQKWRGTSNGFEYLGEQHNDATLILDEMGAIDAVEAGLVAYMLADGAGKTRAKGAAGGLRPKPTWRTLFLSSGEVSLEQHMRTAGKTMKGGQEIRLIPIPAEVSPGNALETSHEFEGGHELSGWVKERAARCYGTAGRAWLEYLIANTEGLTARLRVLVDRIEAQIVPESAAGQFKRGGRRIALVAAAGELATEAGFTGWPVGEATRAALACLTAWKDSRGGAGSSEETNMLRQVRRLLEGDGEGRFTWWHRASDDHSSKTLNRAGMRRLVDDRGQPIKTNSDHGTEYGARMSAVHGEGTTVEFFVTAEVFKSDFCKGFDSQAVARVLLAHECLIPEKGRSFDCKPRLPGMGPTRCYRIPARIFELDL